MSTDPQDPNTNPNAKKLHIWGRPLDSPSSSPSATETTPNGKPADGKPAGDKALDGKDFQQNFPEANGVSLADAVKSIKAEDLLDVHKSACGRQGLMAGIVLGSLVGGLRFVWRGTPLKAANWAVGGFVTGATVGFERCQYLRRLERLSMKRIVEVHQADVEEKKRIREEEERKRAEAEAAERAKKAWYKFW